jgi:ABC-type transport system involved in cytochrome c biogenesis permease subunit
MAEPKTEDNSEEKLRGFRVDVTLVLVGLFLALGVQSIIQFVETVSPHVSPYFYLGVGVVSLFMVLLCLNLAARLAGFVRPDMKKRQAPRSDRKPDI